MTKRQMVIKLEAIRYCIDGLTASNDVKPNDKSKLALMRREIERMLKPFEGVTVYDESADVGC